MATCPGEEKTLNSKPGSIELETPHNKNTQLLALSLHDIFLVDVITNNKFSLVWQGARSMEHSELNSLIITIRSEYLKPYSKLMTRRLLFQYLLHRGVGEGATFLAFPWIAPLYP